MSKFIIGTKEGMTQVFTSEGFMVPVTVISVGSCTVTQIKTLEKDGYSAVQIGYKEIEEKKLNKPQLGFFKKIGLKPKKHLIEFRVDDTSSFTVGNDINLAETFDNESNVDISGRSKGKGFQGTIKRYGQSGGNETHGSMYHRRPGSMGSNTFPGRVFKGKKLPGHMGYERVTVQNLSIVKVDAENGLLLVKGAVPGPKGGVLVIKKSVKNAK